MHKVGGCRQVGSRVKTDPQAMYPLSDRSGPWLVLATTFRGDGARDDASPCPGIRSEYSLTAYTMKSV